MQMCCGLKAVMAAQTPSLRQLTPYVRHLAVYHIYLATSTNGVIRFDIIRQCVGFKRDRDVKKMSRRVTIRCMGSAHDIELRRLCSYPCMAATFQMLLFPV